MYEIFEFYKKELSKYNLIFSHLKIQFVGTWIITGILFIASITVSAINNNSKITLISYGLFLIIFSILMILLAIRSNKILMDKYQIKNDSFKFGGLKYREFKRNKLNQKLFEKKIIGPEKVKRLIDFYEIEAESKKVKFPIIPSVFLILFVPLWTQYMSFEFKNAAPEQGSNILGFYFAVIIFITVAISILKLFFNSTVFEIINRDYYKMKSFVSYLKEIYLETE